ncbi:hypothetical protein [Geodermatophilus sp. TF02-6]|uniref:hypothetical protein n=1 Tax=Geodermatophilus sp. TF02-6 TaxID=2250575 RepID=UPI001314EB8D|nr:hypothetical protein [Geodermatophilus sp. TF02-6]
MSRWLAPLLGAVGLLTLVVGIVWAEWDAASMGGVSVVGCGAVLLAAAGGIAAVHEGVVRRRRRPVPRR